MNINELIEQRVNIKSQIDELRAQEKDLQEIWKFQKFPLVCRLVD